MKTILLLIAAVAGVAYLGTKGYTGGKWLWTRRKQYAVVSAKDGRAV